MGCGCCSGLASRLPGAGKEQERPAPKDLSKEPVLLGGGNQKGAPTIQKTGLACDKGHELKFDTTPYIRYNRYSCSKCNGIGEGKRWCCPACEYDLCLKCGPAPGGQTAPPPAPEPPKPISQGPPRRLKPEEFYNKVVHIQSSFKTFLRAYDDKKRIDLAPHAQVWEEWVISPVENNKVQLKSKWGTFLRPLEDDKIDQAEKRLEWEAWELEEYTGGYAFRGFHRKYLSANENAQVGQNMSCWEKEQFEIILH